MGLFSKFRDWMSGGDTSDDYDKANEMYEEAQRVLDQRAAQKKSVDQLYREGRGVAGQAASDKAGQAKQNAMGAARMGGAGRLQSAIAGAGAAQQASSQGYSEQANAAAGVNAAREGELDALAQAKSNNIKEQANLAPQQAENKANRRMQMMQGATTMAAAALSDGKTKTYKKHTYIPKEDR